MSALRKQFPPSVKPKTFVALLRNNDGTPVHLVKTYDRTQRACWFLLKATTRNIVKLEHTTFEEIIDLTQYGEVIASGWGHLPNQDSVEQ
jgi:hypothetical protein